MRFTTVALVAGVVAGLLAGGRLANLGRRGFRGWPFLAAGLVLPLLPNAGALGASYLCLLAFALLNLRVPGMGLLAVGLGLNALVVGVNAGMPVHQGDAALSGKHHAETGSDSLTFLDDRVPVDPLDEVLSFGDLVLAVGLVVTASSLVRRPPEGRHAQLAEESAGPRLR
ncbi:MAG: hypothetical protein QOK43_874 [Acidimicrobiaceae bacterium]|nr:hypothetical protein [Acidimicrobiaceae bacterium]